MQRDAAKIHTKSIRDRQIEWGGVDKLKFLFAVGTEGAWCKGMQLMRLEKDSTRSHIMEEYVDAEVADCCHK